MPRSRPLAERVWEKIDRSGPTPTHRPDLGPCWLWTAGRDQRGYGNIRTIEGRQRKAHIVVWELVWNCAIPQGLELDHLCRNHSCVRPTHLDPVTHKDNCDRGVRGAFNNRCPQGHEYDRRYTGTRNFRWCKQCHNAASRKHKSKLREQHVAVEIRSD